MSILDRGPHAGPVDSIDPVDHGRGDRRPFVAVAAPVPILKQRVLGQRRSICSACSWPATGGCWAASWVSCSYTRHTTRRSAFLALIVAIVEKAGFALWRVRLALPPTPRGVRHGAVRCQHRGAVFAVSGRPLERRRPKTPRLGSLLTKQCCNVKPCLDKASRSARRARSGRRKARGGQPDALALAAV